MWSLWKLCCVVKRGFSYRNVLMAFDGIYVCQQIVLSKGPCCGVDPCMYGVEDHVSVLYYDSPAFENISDSVRITNIIMKISCDESV